MLDPDEAIDRIYGVYGGPHGSRALHAKGQFYDGTFTATAGGRRALPGAAPPGRARCR